MWDDGCAKGAFWKCLDVEYIMKNEHGVTAIVEYVGIHVNIKSAYKLFNQNQANAEAFVAFNRGVTLVRIVNRKCVCRERDIHAAGDSILEGISNQIVDNNL